MGDSFLVQNMIMGRQLIGEFNLSDAVNNVISIDLPFVPTFMVIGYYEKYYEEIVGWDSYYITAIQHCVIKDDTSITIPNEYPNSIPNLTLLEKGFSLDFSDISNYDYLKEWVEVIGYFAAYK